MTDIDDGTIGRSVRRAAGADEELGHRFDRALGRRQANSHRFKRRDVSDALEGECEV